MATPKRKNPNHLTVVGGNAANLEQMETLLVDFAKETAPSISRASAAKQKMEAEVVALEAELEGIEARQALIQRTYEAMMIAFDADKADVRRAIGLRTGGLTQDKMTAAE